MLPHPIGSAVEYMLRAPYKGSEATDLRKAAWWLKKAREMPDLWNSGYIKIHANPRKYVAAVIAMATKSDWIIDLFGVSGTQIGISESAVDDLIVRLEKRADALEKPQDETEE